MAGWHWQKFWSRLLSYCLNCTKFGQLSSKIIKIVATRCHILKAKCSKIDFRWGSAPDPARETYTVPPDLLTAVKGPISKGKKGKESRREGAGKEREMRERTGAPFNFLPHGAADVVTPLRQGHRRSYHLKAVVWFLISNFIYRGRIVYNFRYIGRGNDNIGWNDLQVSTFIRQRQKYRYSFIHSFL